MNPLNSRINETFRYQRHLLTDEEIQVALDEHKEMFDVIAECGYDPEFPLEMADNFSALQQFKDENEDTIEEAEAAIAFVADIKRVYEDRFGRIFDTQLDTLVQWVNDEFPRCPPHNLPDTQAGLQHHLYIH